jgi:hypothetical protein
VTTNKQLAKDYAGNGKVISKEVRADEILDDITEPLGEEYILRLKKTMENGGELTFEGALGTKVKHKNKCHGVARKKYFDLKKKGRNIQYVEGFVYAPLENDQYKWIPHAWNLIDNKLYDFAYGENNYKYKGYIVKDEYMNKLPEWTKSWATDEDICEINIRVGNEFGDDAYKMEKGGLTHDDIKNKTDKYKGMLKKPSSLLKISQMHKVPMFFLQSQLRKGMKVESEHTNREVIAKIIALHHLEEDPSYYIKLEKIEGKKMAKGGEIDPDNKSIKSAMTHKAGSAGGLLVGNRHSEGGIKAINKSTNTPIEMEGGEVVITRNAVSDSNKREFEGQMLTNREILSKINESGGGVSFASGGKVPSSCKCSGKSYKYGGENITDYDIVKRINSKY